MIVLRDGGRESLPPAWKIAYSAASFILFCTALSVANIPYTALSASITLFSVRERVVEEREERVDFRKNIKVLTANPPYLLLTGGMFLFMIAVGMTASGVNYLFKYNLRAESSASLALLALLGTAGLFIPVYLLLANRTSKRLAFVAGMSILAAVLAALYFVSERGVGLTIGLFVVGGIGMSSIYFCPWAMLPDTVEYSQWKLGVRREGILFGTFFFFQQFGSAVALFLQGMGLHLVGYVANAEQSALSLAGIRLLMSLVPLAFVVAGVVLISFYSITAERHRQIIQEIYGKE